MAQPQDRAADGIFANDDLFVRNDAPWVRLPGKMRRRHVCPPMRPPDMVRVDDGDHVGVHRAAVADIATRVLVLVPLRCDPLPVRPHELGILTAWRRRHGHGSPQDKHRSDQAASADYPTSDWKPDHDAAPLLSLIRISPIWPGHRGGRIPGG